MPIQWKQFYLHVVCYMQHLVVFHIAILHGPAGVCIPVASESPIHVPPVQHVLKHCGMRKHIYTV